MTTFGEKEHQTQAAHLTIRAAAGTSFTAERFDIWSRAEKAMWKITLAGATAIGLIAGASGPAQACRGCDAGYGYRYYAYPKHFRYGFHEYYGFYNSGYRASPGGGFHSVVGPQRFYGAAKRRLGARGMRSR